MEEIDSVITAGSLMDKTVVWRLETDKECMYRHKSRLLLPTDVTISKGLKNECKLTLYVCS